MTVPFDSRIGASLFSMATALLLAGGLIASLPPSAYGQPDTMSEINHSPSEGRVDSLVRQMTLQEKTTLLHGARDPEKVAGAGYVPGISRLGIPPLRLADGPAGIRTAEPATALPAPVVLSATFDPDLARRFGEVIGKEGRARQQDVLLSPMVNIVRVPQAGRNFETFGEDPHLAAQMVAAEIRGIQSQGLIATVKHYAANNFEEDRQRISAEVSERALREIYLPGFEAAVEAGVGAVMCAYNRVNGTYACENSTLLQEVLREDFGFDGWVMTDWFARHSLQAIERGLDQEMPGFTLPQVPQPVYFGDSLRAAVEDGEVPEREVDQSVRRLLGQMERFGLLGGVPERPEINPETGAPLAREVATNGAVLLRNERRNGQKTLPLTEADLSSLVVIGPTAKHPLYGGGGSSRVRPFRLKSPLDALRDRVGEETVIRHEPGLDHDGVPVPAAALAPGEASTQRGLRRTGPDGETVAVDSTVNFVGDDALRRSAFTWRGTLTAPETGTYDLKLQTKGGGGTLSLNGEERLSTAGFFNDASLIPTGEGLNTASAKVEIDTGETVQIAVRVEPEEGSFMNPASDGPMQVRLAWVTPERRRAVRQRAIEAAREAEAAVVFAYNEGTESVDRPSLSLPKTQDALVRGVAETNPRTTVVLNTGDPVTMPWLEKTGAVLQMWYPGQEGGAATADLLTGAANPSGKLPVTFPKRLTDAPTHPTARYPGTGGSAVYSEGVLVGYRWYDAKGIEPLFPFGHGLSYTSFAYSELEVKTAGEGYRVQFQVRNVGERRGAEVTQVYLGAPGDLGIEMAPKQLVGFERVELAAGEAASVTVEIDRRALSYWSPKNDRWVVAPGKRSVQVGGSSRNVSLRTSLVIEDQ